MNTGSSSRDGAARRLTLLSAVAFFAMVALFVAWNRRFNDTPPPSVSTTEPPVSLSSQQSRAADPRISFVTPYRNVRPEVNYVGDGTCSTCHPRRSTTYRSHPMGRSLSPIASAVALERYDSASHNPFDTLGF